MNTPSEAAVGDWVCGIVLLPALLGLMVLAGVRVHSALVVALYTFVSGLLLWACRGEPADSGAADAVLRSYQHYPSDKLGR